MKGASITVFMSKLHVTITEKHVTLDSMNSVILGNTWILREMQNDIQTYWQCAVCVDND